jgi:hypothetical protein
VGPCGTQAWRWGGQGHLGASLAGPRPPSPAARRQARSHHPQTRPGGPGAQRQGRVRGTSPGETVRRLQGPPPHGARAWAFGEVGGLQKTQERASCQAVVGDTPAPEVCSPVTFEPGKRISVTIFR